MTGFLLADGCFLIIRQERNRHYKNKIYPYISFVPRISITQRDDNLLVLQKFFTLFSGNIHHNKNLNGRFPNSKPVYEWNVSNFENCLKISKIVSKSNLPHNKVNAAKIMFKFCKLRLSIKTGKYGKINNSYKQKFEQFRQQIHKANSYKSE